MRRLGIAAVVAVVALLVCVSPALASFGIVPGSLSVDATNADGSVDRAAGSHPFAFSVALSFNHDAEDNAEGSARDVVVDLPAGLVGNPLATPRCLRQQFDGEQARCPGDTQMGTFTVNFRDARQALSAGGALYNLVPPKGVAASFGFSVAGFVAIENATVVRTGGGYTVSVSTNNISHPSLVDVEETIWGVPADAAHDPERECITSKGGKIRGCASGSVPRPFLTLPGSCNGPMTTVLEADSTETPGVYVKETAQSTDGFGAPAGLLGCERLQFDPSVFAQPESTNAATSSGLDVDVHVPQPESTSGLAEADVNETAVSLPPGMVVNPSSAEGLGACSSAQIDLEGNGPAQCPPASAIGTVTVDTPLLDHPLLGTVYLAAQGDNPFGSLLAIYIVVDDPETGTVIKLAGHVEADPLTGQMRTSVADLPQFPFSDVKVDINGGPRASLLTPDTCGTKITTAVLKPWTAPEGFDADSSSSFAILGGPLGSRCAFAPVEEPNNPSFAAGTTFPQAGAFSPFQLRLSREQGSQQFVGLQTVMPPGLTGKLAGIARCTDSQIAAAERSGRTGLEEGQAPSCPSASEVGTAVVAAGAGAHPLQVTGRVYLAGPYRGAPFSLVVITPAVAGPFDLGTVVVRAALQIDPTTAQVTVLSDPFPTILDGIPLDVRSIFVNVDRQEFTLNPTSCNATSIQGLETSTLGMVAPLNAGFQTQGCQNLPFAPKLSATVTGHASKAQGTRFVVKVTSPGVGQANIQKVMLQLPKQLPSRLTTIQKACPAATFEANPASCDEGSVIGTATIHTPILDNPLSGPAYLVSHGGAAFPDVEFILQGENGLKLVLDGKTQIKGGITYSRFESAPDAPFTSFEAVLPAGPHSALTANVAESKQYNLCGENLQIPTTIVGQNGAKIEQPTQVAIDGCAAVRAAKVKKLTLAQQLKRALAQCRKRYKHSKSKRIRCETQAHTRYTALALAVCRQQNKHSHKKRTACEALAHKRYGLHQ
jgi:hypothetical protein